jgi:NAD(P)-dependent dehydrogenase (short-subunit alcohol dehydrogenase family)
MPETPFAGRIALVTGASRGFGRALALELARAGAHVIALAKGKAGLEALDDEIRALGGAATLVPLDLRKFDGLDALGAEVFKRWKKLDILVGNAGILGPLTPLHQVTPEEWQEVIDVNLTANFRLIRSFHPLLRASDAPRAVFVTSGVTARVRGYWGPYAVAKAGLEMLVLSWAAENEKGKLRVNLIDPGAMRTAMRAAAYPGEDPLSLPTPEEVAPRFLKLLSPALTRTGERLTRDAL